MKTEKIKIIIKVEKDKEIENEKIKRYFKSVCDDAFKKGNEAEIIIENESRLE